MGMDEGEEGGAEKNDQDAKQNYMAFVGEKEGKCRFTMVWYQWGAEWKSCVEEDCLPGEFCKTRKKCTVGKDWYPWIRKSWPEDAKFIEFDVEVSKGEDKGESEPRPKKED